jgi:glucose uptake protein GlcU
MRRAVGIFLIIQSLLTYLIVDALCDPFKIKEKDTMIDLDTGVTTVSYSYRLPGIYSLSCVILIITFILGIYFILAEKKKRELKTQHFYN